MLTTATLGRETVASQRPPINASSFAGTRVHDHFDPDTDPHLAHYTRILSRSGNCKLFDEGEEASSLYRIVQGAAMTYVHTPDGRRQVTGFFFAGDLLGFSADNRYIHSALIIAPSRLRAYSSRQLEGMCDTFSGVERFFLEAANNELRMAREHIDLLNRKNAEEQFALLLCRLARRQVARGEADNPIRLPMSRSAIADYLGLTIETVSRLFTKLCNDNVISKAGLHFVYVREPENLAEMASGL